MNDKLDNALFGHDDHPLNSSPGAPQLTFKDNNFLTDSNY